MRSPGAAARSPAVPRQKEYASFYVGTRVAKQFEAGLFHGAVVSTRHAAPHGDLFKVAYGDGDSEELTWAELCAVVVKRKRPRKRALAAAVQPALRFAAASPAAPAHARAATQYSGVSAAKNGMFMARGKLGAEPSKALGRFCTAEDAARAVDRWLRSRGAPASTLNFPGRAASAADDQDAAGCVKQEEDMSRALPAQRRPVPLQPVMRRAAAAAPAPAVPLAAARRWQSAEAAFVNALQPPLSAPAAVAVQLQAGGVTMAHLLALGGVLARSGVAGAAKERLVAAAFADCGVHPPRDKATLCAALQRAHHRHAASQRAS